VELSVPIDPLTAHRDHKVPAPRSDWNRNFCSRFVS